MPFLSNLQAYLSIKEFNAEKHHKKQQGNKYHKANELMLSINFNPYVFISYGLMLLLPLFTVSLQYSVEKRQVFVCLLAFCFVFSGFVGFSLHIAQNKAEASLESHCLHLKMDAVWCLLSSEIGSREKSAFPITITSYTLMTDMYQATPCIYKQTSSTLRSCFSRHPNDRLSMSNLVDQYSVNSNAHHAA